MRHGFYPRLQPEGTQVRRFLCQTTGRTVSLLPDCLASHWRGDLDTMEEVARQAEGKSRYQAAQEREWAGVPNPPDSVAPETPVEQVLSPVAMLVIWILMQGQRLLPPGERDQPLPQDIRNWVVWLGRTSGFRLSRRQPLSGRTVLEWACEAAQLLVEYQQLKL